MIPLSKNFFLFCTSKYFCFNCLSYFFTLCFCSCFDIICTYFRSCDTDIFLSAFVVCRSPSVIITVTTPLNNLFKVTSTEVVLPVEVVVPLASIVATTCRSPSAVIAVTTPLNHLFKTT